MKHIIKRYEITGFTLFESLYPPGLKQERHEHAQASFSYVLAGGYVESYGKKSQTRQPTSMVFHPPQESHSVAYGSEAVRILSIQVDPARLTYIRERSTVLDSSISCRTETIAWLGHKVYGEFCRRDAASSLAIEGLVFEILAETSRKKAVTTERKSPRWLEQAEEFLHDNFSESFVFNDVARIAGVHPAHLARVFREKNGCTIGEYVRRLRVEFACRQISATEKPLHEIALVAGFADQSHLTKIFKTHFGLTPSQYRRISRAPLV